jgi:hypothetical protein
MKAAMPQIASTYKEKKDKSIMEELKKWRNCAMMTNMKNFLKLIRILGIFHFSLILFATYYIKMS